MASKSASWRERSDGSFICTIAGCPYPGTPKKVNIFRHGREYHLDIRPFGCNHAGCAYRATTTGHLKKHLWWHLKDTVHADKEKFERNRAIQQRKLARRKQTPHPVRSQTAETASDESFATASACKVYHLAHAVEEQPARRRGRAKGAKRSNGFRMSIGQPSAVRRMLKKKRKYNLKSRKRADRTSVLEEKIVIPTIYKSCLDTGNQVKRIATANVASSRATEGGSDHEENAADRSLVRKDAGSPKNEPFTPTGRISVHVLNSSDSEVLDSKHFLTMEELESDALASLISPLRPAVTSFVVLNQKHASSANFQAGLMEQPCAVLTNFAYVIGLRGDLFSTTLLAETNSNQMVTARSGKETHALRTLVTDEDWKDEQVVTRTTLGKYAAFQSPGLMANKTSDVAYQNSGYTAADYTGARFELDYHDLTNFQRQLAEMDKFPLFLHLLSPKNLLQYLESPLFRIVKVSMLRSGHRTVSTARDLSVCSLNLSVGPGDCQWFCVSSESSVAWRHLLQSKNISYLEDGWWPNLNDVYDANIPVYSFIQRVGDVVWINSGTVYWTQAISRCNTVSWNIAPSTAHQYNLALDHYELHKLHRIRPTIPMLHLSWRLATNMTFASPDDDDLLQALREVLYRTVTNVRHVFRVLDGCSLEPEQIPDDGLVYFCAECKGEIFNVVCTYDARGLRAKGEEAIRCCDCALEADKKLAGFAVRYRHTIQQLYRMMP